MTRLQVILTALITLASAIVLFHFQFARPGAEQGPASLEEDGRDSRYIFEEGQRLRSGVNPYERTLDGDMIHNDKYATLAPLSYTLAAASQIICPDYVRWLKGWKVFSVLCHLAIGLAMIRALHRNGWLAMLLVLLFWLNRWSLRIFAGDFAEPLPVLFLILSIVLLPRRPLASTLLLGASLALKQMAVIAVPIYVLYLWRRYARREQWKQGALCLGAMVIIPVLSILPFLLWNARAFVLSMLFSGTREGAMRLMPLEGYYGIRSGMLSRSSLLLALALIYLVYFVQQVSLRTAVFLTMLAFLMLNPVQFPQYFYWPLALLPLVLVAGEEDLPVSQRLSPA